MGSLLNDELGLLTRGLLGAASEPFSCPFVVAFAFAKVVTAPVVRRRFGLSQLISRGMMRYRSYI